MSDSRERISAKLRHAEALKFDVDLDGRKIGLNSAKVMDGAFTPMELFLVALAGCTAMDIQWIMDRQRQQVNKFDLAVTGVRRQEDPSYFESIDLRYDLAGTGIRKDAVERAIRLSMEKYCSVRAMIKDSVKLNITYTISDGKQPEITYNYSLA